MATIKEYSLVYAKQFIFYLAQSRNGRPSPGDLVGHLPFTNLNKEKKIGIIMWARAHDGEENFSTNSVGIMWSL
jgi:hypothetical protein